MINVWQKFEKTDTQDVLLPQTTDRLQGDA